MTTPPPGFDTGLPAPQRTLLRNAIATRLAPLLKSNGNYLAAIASLPRPLRNTSADELGWLGYVLQGQAPAVLIALGGEALEPNGMDFPATSFSGELDVVLYLASNSARSYVIGRLESDVRVATDRTVDPGIDAMLEHVQQMLLGHDYHLDPDDPTATSELRFVHQDEVYTGGDFTIWEQKCRIRLERELNPDRYHTVLLDDGTPAPLTEIETDTNLDDADPINPIVVGVTQLPPEEP